MRARQHPRLDVALARVDDLDLLTGYQDYLTWAEEQQVQVCPDPMDPFNCYWETQTIWHDDLIRQDAFSYDAVGNRTGQSIPYKVLPPITTMPFWNRNGDAAIGVFSTGARRICNPPTTERGDCVSVVWTSFWSAFDRKGSTVWDNWHGTVLESKRDKTNLSYSRNRYYDPQTGRFTQEDPIGLAGGLNLYGFAGGDPVNFSDPFGLNPYVNCRPVTGNPSFGHCAIRVIDARRKLDVTIELIPTGASSGALLGRKQVYWSQGPDNERTRAYDAEGWVQVATPEGMTDEEFDTAVLRAAAAEGAEVRGDRYFFTGKTNSNAFVYRVITRAGGKVPSAPAKRFPKGAPGLCGGKGLGNDCAN